jgi:hypothetical protein
MPQLKYHTWSKRWLRSSLLISSMFLCVTSSTNFTLPFSSFLTCITLLFTSLLNKHTIKELGSCSAGSLCIDTTSLSSKVTFRSRLTKSVKSWHRFCFSLLGKLRCMMTLTLNSDNGFHNVLGGNFKFLMLKNI